ncbi:Protein Red [Merluccius polli]|uniref:NADH dehydrogenase [ubiquinone] 1 alpha subcomplex subunit 2 n=1 Tax=Merluccius polli TaxID=89951 RepID=A0AA47NWY5_MERPO|nr:Protein Red [Merluccius polli]
MAAATVRALGSSLSRNLREIRLHVCQTSAGSQGARDFVEQHYVSLKRSNPDFPILVRECSGVQPRLWARYDIGYSTDIHAPYYSDLTQGNKDTSAGMSPMCLAASTCPGVYLPRYLPAQVYSCPGVYLPRCLPVQVSTCPGVYLSRCLPAQVSTCPGVYLPRCLPVQVYSCPGVYLPRCIAAQVSTCPGVYLSRCLPAQVSTCPDFGREQSVALDNMNVDQVAKVLETVVRPSCRHHDPLFFFATMPETETYSNPLAPDGHEMDDHTSALQSKLTNDDFRKLLMTPRSAPSSAPPSKSRHHEMPRDYNEDEDPAARRRKKKRRV